MLHFDLRLSGASLPSARRSHLRAISTTTANQTVQRTGASRFAQRQIERHRRLAPVADLCVRQRIKIMESTLDSILDQAEEGYLIPCRRDDNTIDLLARASNGDTLLHVAVGMRDFSAIRRLLEARQVWTSTLKVISTRRRSFRRHHEWISASWVSCCSMARIQVFQTT